ncbi:hypothetical protein HY251_01445 [bacterium]|nr:hypothetical protein [bacterium]
MRPRLVSLTLAAALGALSALAFSRTPAALADDPRASSSPPYRYYPRGSSSGLPELLDARTGAVYRRSEYGARWELVTKPVSKEE